MDELKKLWEPLWRDGEKDLRLEDVPTVLGLAAEFIDDLAGSRNINAVFDHERAGMLHVLLGSAEKTMKRPVAYVAEKYMLVRVVDPLDVIRAEADAELARVEAHGGTAGFALRVKGLCG